MEAAKNRAGVRLRALQRARLRELTNGLLGGIEDAGSRDLKEEREPRHAVKKNKKPADAAVAAEGRFAYA